MLFEKFRDAFCQPYQSVPCGITCNIAGEVLAKGLLTLAEILQLGRLTLQGFQDVVGGALLHRHLDKEAALFIGHAVVDAFEQFAAHQGFSGGGVVHRFILAAKPQGTLNESKIAADVIYAVFILQGLQGHFVACTDDVRVGGHEWLAEQDSYLVTEVGVHL